jgi:hypothetical protein
MAANSTVFIAGNGAHEHSALFTTILGGAGENF